MKIVIDDKIPYIREAISRITPDAVYIKGTEISAADVRDADALIVRTRTRCNEALLEGSRVQFVATATTGFDHIDTGYLRQSHIEWMNCPGCNASSVAQYVRSVLLLLKRDKGFDLSRTTLGIVGCGHVGAKVKAAAQALGMSTLVCDPPRQQRGDEGEFVDIDTIERLSDVITFHVPLTIGGAYATHHMADEGFFSRLERRPVVINSSRGAVADNIALTEAIDSGKIRAAVVDTWENEPLINRRLLGKAWIATPHIAGYSADGKVNADNMVIAGLCRHFGIEAQPVIAPPPLPYTFIACDNEDELNLRLYNPLEDSARLKAAPESFEELRGNYPLRRETYTRNA